MTQPEQPVVFYSWQSDLPKKDHHYFIGTALKRAIKAIHTDASVFVRPILTSDTQGVAGAKRIDEVIFAKIKTAAVFVADVSFINPGASAERLTPNPNVMIEVGYALRHVEEDILILVLNTATGRPEDLPFDLRGRRMLPYTLHPGALDHAAARRQLAKDLEEALRHIFHQQAEVAGRERRRSATARAAVEERRPDQVPLVRRFMGRLVDEIRERATPFATTPHLQWDDVLVKAIAGTEDLVIEFARLSDAIASMDATQAARAVYKAFTGVLELYNKPPGWQGGVLRPGEFDSAKFLGHELFVTFFASLIREDRWELIGDLLDESLAISNVVPLRPGAVLFTHASQHIILLDERNRRLGLLRTSLHADLLKERHTRGDLATLVPFREFVEADYFLFLRDQLQHDEAPDTIRWAPWTVVYLEQPPRYLQEAVTRLQAQHLAHALRVPDIPSLRERFAARAPRVQQLYRRVGWSSADWLEFAWHVDPSTMGTR